MATQYKNINVLSASEKDAFEMHESNVWWQRIYIYAEYFTAFLYNR